MKIKALAVGVLLAVAGSANAAINPGSVGAPTNGNSEFFLTVFDPSAQMSYNLDMGGDAYSFYGTNSFASFNLAADADYAAFVGQTDLSYTVTAAYRNFDTVEDVAAWGMYSTSGSSASALTTTLNTLTAIEGGASRISNMALNINGNAAETGQPNSGFASFEINNSSVAVIGGTGYYDVPTWNDTLGGTGYTASGAVGSALDFYHIGLDVNELVNNGMEVSYAQLLGSWSLGANGMLTYSAAGTNPVPVPAAAWLFGSGLLGLVGVARRKAA
jgi:hypothetical protein